MGRPPNPAPRETPDAFIARLYRSGLSVPAHRFRAFALAELSQLIRYDGALWGSGSIKRWRFHTVTVTGLPDDFPEALEATREINPILPAILSRLDTPVDMESVCPDRRFFRSEIYRRCFARYGIRRILSTGHVDARSGLYSLLTLYRRNRADRFSRAEKALQKRAAHHLFQSASHAYFLHLWRSFPERPAGSAAAVVDREGVFHEAQPRFLDLLERHYPARDPQVLPFAPPDQGRTQRLGELCVQSEALGDLLCVSIWPAGPLDRLTEREREIVQAVAQGLSFKEAAKRIGVAPSTVANHLYRVYRKLGVNSRTELASLVYP